VMLHRFRITQQAEYSKTGAKPTRANARHAGT
jgi:hypothetical protein